MRYLLSTSSPADEEVSIFSAPSPGQRWRAFLPLARCIGGNGALNGTNAYMVFAKRWARAGSKTRAKRWVPVGRSKTGLRLDSSGGTSIWQGKH